MSDPQLQEDRLGGAPGYDELGLSPTDRDKLSYLVGIDPKLAREYLEEHFGATFQQIAGEIEETKRQNEREAQMLKDYERFLLHYSLFLNTPRNQQTILVFLEENGLTTFNYHVLVEIWNQYAHVDGKLDLDEGTRPNARLYIGQKTPGSEFDSDSGYTPRKLISQMTAQEFSNAIARSPKFRARIDGD